MLSRIFKDSLNDTYAMVSIDYKCYSNINHLNAKGGDVNVKDDRSLSYMYKPRKKKDDDGTYVDGGGYCLFSMAPCSDAKIYFRLALIILSKVSYIHGIFLKQTLNIGCTLMPNVNG